MKAPALLFALLFSLLPPLTRAETAAPPLAAMAAANRPGLALTFTTAAGQSDVRTARLVALEVPAGQPASAFLPAGAFTARWEGVITSELRAEYSFAVEVLGGVKVTINDAVLLEGEVKTTPKPVQLKKGANRLLVEYTSPAQGEAMLRLKWMSREFPWEPVPPSALQHEASALPLRTAARLREGRLLFAQHRCTACHEAAALLPPKGEGMPELAQDAPIFDAIGEKFREPWLAAWISDPHAIRPQGLMPRVFADGAKGGIDQRAADLAAYFASTAAPAEDKPLDETLAPAGGALFANLGCIACHAKPDAEGPDEHQRVPLGHVRAKWRAAALTAYLLDPAKNYAWTRMPNFRLSDPEAAQLTAYLLTTAKRDFPAGPKGDATRGAQLLVSANCLNCHAGLPPMTTPPLAAALAGGAKGCLAADAAARGKAPDFGFTAAQREALAAFTASGLGSLKQDAPAEFSHRQIANLRCTACHSRDGEPSLWSKLEEEVAALQSLAPLAEGEGQPIATTALPQLTWFGEKLRPDYLAAFIAGQGGAKPRPWIVARMPGFAAAAEPMAHGLALDHGFPLALSPEPAGTPEQLRAGETLVGENGGFNCTQCHALGEKPATAVFEAPAPNLALAAARLRRGYYDRWLLFPQRIDPDTKMPRFADDEGKTPLGELFDGKASEQYAAIWKYLQTLKR